jgi:uncharacterized protein YbaP (TraB family)
VVLAVLLGLMSVSALVLAEAETMPAPAAAGAGGFDQGLLFRLEPPGGGAAPNWLFGTIHSEDPRVLALPVAVSDALASARVVVIEVVPDQDAMQAALAAMTLGEGRTLADLLPRPLYREALDALETRGMPETAVARLKPWAAMLLLSTPPAKTGTFLDLMLYDRARAAGKPVLGLESMHEQLGVFDGFSDADQVRLLEQALDDQALLSPLFERLIQCYLRRDLQGLLHLERDQLAGTEPGLAARFHRAMVVERNRRMAERVAPMLRRGGHFIAVGALHLPGEDGLLNRLRAAGFLVRRAD